MKHILTGLKIIGLLGLLVESFCSCASTEAQKSSAEKEREARYSDYVDRIDKEWSTYKIFAHFQEGSQQSSSEPVYEASAEGRRFPEFNFSFVVAALRKIFIPRSSMLRALPTSLLTTSRCPLATSE